MHRDVVRLREDRVQRAEVVPDADHQRPDRQGGQGAVEIAAARPSPVNVVVRSVPHMVSTVSGMMVPSWFRGPRGEPTRRGVSKSFSRLNRSTRRNEVRVPACRNRAQTLPHI